MISVRHGCKSSIASKTKVYNVNPRWLLCDNGEFKLFFDLKSRLGWIMVPKAFPKPFQEVPRQGHGKKIGPTLTACGLKFDINLICMWAYERNRLSFRFANYLWRNNSRQPIRHLEIVPINQWDSEVKQPNVKHVHEPKHSKWFSLGTGGTLHSDEGLTLGTSPFMDDYTPKITFSLLLFRMLVMDGGRCNKDTF